nr:MAG TPA: hypothetical protein [Caudoviricetes sp.]
MSIPINLLDTVITLCCFMIELLKVSDTNITPMAGSRKFHDRI